MILLDFARRIRFIIRARREYTLTGLKKWSSSPCDELDQITRGFSLGRNRGESGEPMQYHLPTHDRGDRGSKKDYRQHQTESVILSVILGELHHHPLRDNFSTSLEE